MHAGEQLGLDDGSLAGRVGLIRALVLIGVALVIGGLLVFRGLDSGTDTVAAGPDASTPASGGTGAADEGTVDDVGATPGSTPGDEVDGEASPAALSTVSTAPATTVAAVSEAATSAPAPGAASTTATTVGASTSAAPTGAASTTVLVLNAASGKGVAAAGAQILKDAGYTVMAPRNANGPSKSKILYTKGNEAAADGVAAVFDVDPAAVVGAFDPSRSPITTIGDADVIVVIGTDGVIKTS
ncbi:MAG: LytR C-terminal domain-containing protein [Acidimicrobiia bacterium]|nr:LytR C-terminal domain-containing protein [Acidimicrobiia bacterium]MDH4364575.1 LytR C-terminal domain-containing protein [Acidimicrobiia bacterium]